VAVSRWVGRLFGVRRELAVPGGGGASRVAGPVDTLVVGGGIAGMSAAVVLAERGVQVTVLEAQPTLGGRLAARPEILADGTGQPVDHGFHAFFRQYYNWRAILRRIDPALGFLRPVPGYPVISARWPAEEFGRLPPAAPTNLLALIARSRSLRLWNLRTMDGRAALPLLAYHPERTYAELDGRSAAELLDSLRLPDRARAMLFEVFSHSFFNHEREMSAAEMVANFHFYLLGNPEGLAFDAPEADYDTAIWAPLAGRLAELGGRVHTGETVARVDPARGGTGPDAADGAAGRGRARWRVVTASGDVHTACHVVLAVDPPALGALLTASTELARAAPTLARQVARHGAGAPYAVARYWLGGDVAPGRAVFSGVSRQRTLDSVTLYHRLERRSRDWAARVGGSVLELHAYACDPGVPADELAGRMRAELAELWPEVAGLPVVGLRARVQAQAPSFRPGQHAERPGVVTDADGLLLAGDGIRADLPSALMERAAVTGILAANHILRREGGAREPLWSIRRRGLLARR
jgi:isorenieratene synthase